MVVLYSKSNFINHQLCIRCQFIADLPAIGIFDTVLNWKLLTLLRIQIIRTIGVSGEDDLSIEALVLPDHIGNDGCSMSTAKAPGSKIILHINDNQVFYRGLLLSVCFINTL